MGCVHTPHYISDNSQDLNPAFGIGIGEPSIISERALLVDALGAVVVTNTDTLFQKGDGLQGIASVTKVMTLIVALEAVQDNLATLDGEVEISATAAAVGGSQMALEEGETQTLRTLLQGLMIESGNDAAQAIAEHVGCALSPPDDMPCGDPDETENDHSGYAETFIERIIDKVVELGMGSSIYCQPAGGCFSTSQDQVGLWLSAYKTPQFGEFSGAEQYDADACGETEDGEEKCYTNSRTVAARYPGMESWKGGSLGILLRRCR